MRRLIYLVFIFFLPFGSYAQGEQRLFSFTQILKNSSPEEKNINTVFQDSRGFLWLASRKGIIRYDGLNFKHYNILGKKGITDWVITCITEDKKGHVWFGTENGLNKLDPYTETFTQFYAGNGPGTIPYNWCNQLYTDTKGNLWLSTEKGIALYDATANSFINYPVKLYDKDERINKFIKKITEDSGGKFWLATSNGIKQFDPVKRTFTLFTTGTTAQDNVIYSLFTDHNKRVWAGSFSGALFRLNTTTQQFEKILPPATTGNINPIFAINEIKTGSDHYLLMATGEGLHYLKNDGVTNTSFYAAQPGKLWLQEIFNDRQQHTWVSGTQGLYQLNKNSFLFNWLPVPGMPGSEPVYHIIPSLQTNTSFYLTSSTGWWTYNSADNSISKQKIPFSKNRILEYINNWVADEKGYWFSSVNGFGYYDAGNNRLTDLSDIIYQYSGQFSTGYIVRVTYNKYWITMRRSGILEYDAATGKHQQLFADKNNPDNTYGQSISDMQKNTDGFVYFIAQGKLYKVNPADHSYKTFQPKENQNIQIAGKAAPQKILLAPGNKIFVSSNIKIYQLQNDSLQDYYPGAGLSKNSIERIIAGSNNHYWIFSGQEIFYSTNDFTQWQKMNFLPGWYDSTLVVDIYTGLKNKTIFAAKASIGILNNSILYQNNPPLPVLISRVQYGNKENFIPGNNSVIKTGFKDAVQIELSPLNFETENKMYYKLKGWDNEWKELVNTATVRYEQLPAGTYTFLAKSANSSGQESNETAVQLKIIPAFYRTWWFIVLLVISAAAAAYAFYKYKLLKAVELEKMRTRIATDLHDDIGATLSSISMYSESLKGQVKEKLPHLEPVLNKMGENSREMVTGMSDIVWAINPGNDTGGKLVQRMENYATDMCAVKNIALHFEADEKLNQIILPLEKRKNIYLIFKEAMNNAVKYSGAKNITVKIDQQQQLQMQISDDGKGFEQSMIKKGNGLNNMAHRANEMKAKLQLTSQPEAGTTINVQVNI